MEPLDDRDFEGCLGTVLIVVAFWVAFGVFLWLQLEGYLE